MMGSTTTRMASTVVLAGEAVEDELVVDNPAWRIIKLANAESVTCSLPQ